MPSSLFIFRNIIGLLILLLIANKAMAICTVTANSVNLGMINIGTESRGLVSTVSNCTANTPYSYSFSSLNGGASGRLMAGTCTLTYKIVSYTANSGVYGLSDYFNLPPPSLIGSGLNQTDTFGLVVPAIQGNCILIPNAASITVTDTLNVWVNY
jgi:hypothetical protein